MRRLQAATQPGRFDWFVKAQADSRNTRHEALPQPDGPDLPMPGLRPGAEQSLQERALTTSWIFSRTRLVISDPLIYTRITSLPRARKVCDLVTFFRFLGQARDGDFRGEGRGGDFRGCLNALLVRPRRADVELKVRRGGSSHLRPAKTGLTFGVRKGRALKATRTI